MKKKSLLSPPKLKGKKARHLECMLGPSHWLHEISLPKRVPRHFWPQLIPLAKNTLPIWGYLFCFILIVLGCLTSPKFFFCSELQKKLNLWGFPKVEDSIER
jgi:hypothetical protein